MWSILSLLSAIQQDPMLPAYYLETPGSTLVCGVCPNNPTPLAPPLWFTLST